VPLTAGGNLKIVASSNLGGLGAKDGAAVNYNWGVPSIAPSLLPWLAILALLTLKPNRTAAAWLIWLPLGCVLALTLTPPVLPSGANFLVDAIAALAIGWAAVWLLSDYLRRPHRLLTFLSVLLVLAGFSALALVSRQGWSLLELETLQIGIVLAVAVVASAVALALGGWLCRKAFRPLALYLWLFLSLVVVWFLIATPFFLFALMASGGQIPWSEFLIPVLVVAIGNFALLLPFLILSSANPLFRERLKALLHARPEIPPILPDPILKI
jgi:hypothetical protein